jgi:hypothetical protein
MCYAIPRRDSSLCCCIQMRDCEDGSPQSQDGCSIGGMNAGKPQHCMIVYGLWNHGGVTHPCCDMEMRCQRDDGSQDEDEQSWEGTSVDRPQRECSRKAVRSLRGSLVMVLLSDNMKQIQRLTK